MSIFKVKINDMYSVNGNSYPADDPLYHMLLITGMDEHSERYEPFALKLNEERISVDVLDFFGQGQNAESIEKQEIWPKNAWNMMLDALKIHLEELKKDGKPVFLMGHSMGSILVQNFLHRYPKTADKVIIMGSLGPRGMLYSLCHLICKMFYREKNDTKESKLMTSLILGRTNKRIKEPKTPFDWLSHDEENVKKYINDPYCGHYNTWGFYKEFTYGLSQLYKKSNLANLSKDEKIFLIAGEDDPIGGYGKLIKKLYNLYKKKGIEDVKMILYPNMRHEILNEENKDIVINDIIQFLLK